MTDEEIKLLKKGDYLSYQTRVYCYDSSFYSNKYNPYIYIYLLTKARVKTVENDTKVIVHGYNSHFTNNLANNVKNITSKRRLNENFVKLEENKMISITDDTIQIIPTGNQYILVGNYILEYLYTNYTDKNLVKIFFYLLSNFVKFNIKSDGKNQFNFTITELSEKALGRKYANNGKENKKIKNILNQLEQDGFIKTETYSYNFIHKDTNRFCTTKRIRLLDFTNKDKIFDFITKEELDQYRKLKSKFKEKRTPNN